MSQYQGKGGRLVKGGLLENASYVNGSLNNATSMNIDGNGSTLKGTVLVGDVFTLAGETGGQPHTVTLGPYVTAANAITGITFTPATNGAVSDNAAITWVANTVAQIRDWSLDVQEEMLDISVMGDDTKKYVGGRGEWTGSASAILDYGDTLGQKLLIDAIVASTPLTTPFGLTLRVTGGTSGLVGDFYGGALLSRASVTGRIGDLFLVTFNFRGSGAVGALWLP